ncbi:hypothetical protein [Xenorhabdus sp. PB30.3]|uniref:hypothetical protein n=1 Tax=Xenorhabdus sp. PB30.3 TaxID=2788941 RepID=UPI001E46665A|nr:hypothetical protein [Xenorhabdus sp. PB30.3]MCC8378157.1 hypothetical protein [Xenorhabdus sp. PB30.3]
MNAKSKIFLALALVLSVTACSKGGGSHSSLATNKNPDDDDTRIIPLPTQDNTYIAYKPNPSDSTSVDLANYVGKNVWFALSGDYSLDAGSQENRNQNKIDYGQNQKDPGQYDYIQFGQTGDYVYIAKDLGKPGYKLFKNKANNATLGHTDKDIYLASPWMKVEHQNDGSNTYHGNVVFQQDKTKQNMIRDDLTMTLNTHKQDMDNMTFDASIQFDGKVVATLLQQQVQALKNKIIVNGVNSFHTTQEGFGFLNGQTISWGYTDKDATSVSGIIGDPKNNDQYGAFLLNKG